MRIKAKFWIENNGEVVAGGGKIGLLLAVDRLGSIQRAADELGMSYRHAWGIIKKIEQRAGFRMVDAKVGGREEERTRLTSEGKAFIQKMDCLLKSLHATVEKQFQKKFRNQSLKSGI